MYCFIIIKYLKMIIIIIIWATDLLIHTFISDCKMFYRCCHCNILIKRSEYKLLRHCEKCPDVERPDSKFKYVCFICSYHTYQKNHMRIHLRKHTGKKPHVCDMCDYKTSKSSDLKRHYMRMHTVKIEILELDSLSLSSSG